MRLSRLVAAAASANLFCVGVAAQTAPDPDIEEIIIRATPLSDTLQPTDVLTEEALQLKMAATIGETLANELGVSSSYFGPASSRPIIRGLSGSRVTMLTDSVSTLDVSDVSPDHAVAVEPLLADQIEIIRGPTTLLYGSAAAGGVVNVVDSRIHEKHPDESIGGGLEVRGDTASEERTIVGRLDAATDAFVLHVDGFKRETDDVDIAGFATADPAERTEDEVEGKLANSYSESDGYAVGLTWVGEAGYLGASYSDSAQTYGLPGEGEEEAGHGEEEPALFPGPFLDMEQTRVDLRGKYLFPDSAWESVQVSIGTNDYEHNEIEPSGEVATNFVNEAWQARVEAIHAPLAGWRGALGVQVDDRDFAALGEEAFIAPTVTESVGVFVVEERDFDWGHLHVGARVDATEHTNQSFASYDESALSLSVGFGIALADDTELTINVSQTARNPNSEELYSNGPHLATGQFELGLLTQGGRAVTEDSTNVDFSVGRHIGEGHWEWSLFVNDIADYVFQNLTSDIEDGLPVALYAQQDAKFVGFEGAVTFPLFAQDRFANDLRLFADYVDAELDDGSSIPRLPPLRVGANFTVDNDVWLAGLDVVYHAERSDISSFATDSYTLVDARFLYRIERQGLSWQLFARGTNLLDEDARKSTSFLAAVAPLPGRALHAGVRLRF